MPRSIPLAGVFLLAAACATSAPAPDNGSETAAHPLHAPGTGLQGGDTLAVHRGMGNGGMAGQMGEGMRHRHGMGPDSARGGMGMQHGQGMGMGRGMGMGSDSARGGMGMQHGQGTGMGRGMGMRGGAPAAPREVPEEFREGERLFQDVCSHCHTLEPPPNLAPPMTHVARHLRQAFATEEEALAHLRSYLPAPARDRSILPDMPHERFGLMPALPLSPTLLDAVGRYVWFLGEGN